MRPIVAGLIVCGLFLAYGAASSPKQTPKSQTPKSFIEVNPSLRPDIDGRYPVIIRQPLQTPVVYTDVKDEFGNPAVVSCSMCHDSRAPNRDNRHADDLDEFHSGLSMAHGDLSCISCHNRTDYDTLALADGTPVPYADAMKLCAQCHGPQTRDYRNGSHGGMTGYWDLTKGPRLRNNCVDCHDSHAPAFPSMIPVAPSADRFLEAAPHATHERDDHD